MTPEAVRGDAGWLEGRLLRVDVLPDGTLTLVQRATGLRWPLLLGLETPEEGRWRRSPLEGLTVWCPEPGPLAATAALEGRLRSGARFRARCTLRAGEPFLRLKARADGPFRALFPTRGQLVFRGRQPQSRLARRAAGLVVAVECAEGRLDGLLRVSRSASG